MSSPDWIEIRLLSGRPRRHCEEPARASSKVICGICPIFPAPLTRRSLCGRVSATSIRRPTGTYLPSSRGRFDPAAGSCSTCTTEPSLRRTLVPGPSRAAADTSRRRSGWRATASMSRWTTEGASESRWNGSCSTRTRSSGLPKGRASARPSCARSGKRTCCLLPMCPGCRSFSPRLSADAVTMSDPGELLDPVRQYLAAARYAVLATNDPHLVPHQVVVHYRLESTGLLVNGRADRRWVRNLRRDSHVSLLVPDADRPLHFVRIAGTAELIRTGNPAVEDAMTLARRYGEDPSAYPGQDRVSFRIVPRRVYEYG